MDRDTRWERLRTHLCVNNSRQPLRGGLAWGFLDITGLGGAGRQPGCGLKPWSRRRQTQKRPLWAATPEEVVELQRLVAGAARVGEPVPPSPVVTTHSPSSPPRNDRRLLLTQRWVRSLYTVCPGPTRTSLLSPPGLDDGKPAALSTRAMPSRRQGERPRYLQSVLEGYQTFSRLPAG